MNTAKFTTLICFILFGVNSMSAQYGGGGYGNTGGYGGANGGMNRNQNQQSIQNTNNFGRNEKSPETIEKERAENINKAVTKLTKELELDDLQVIVIQKEIESCSKKIYKVVKSESPEEDKTKEIQAINEEMDLTILTFLNDTQKVKYKKIVEERNAKMDNYRNKK